MVEHFRPQTYVSEFRPHMGETWIRASCTRHLPTWRGVWHKFSTMIPYLSNGSRRDPQSVYDELRDRALREAFEHADGHHGGALA